MKIGICHENIVEYDAVGNDITRSAFLLVELGFVVYLIGENISESIQNKFSIIHAHSNWNLSEIDLIIYHHSVFWGEGESLLKRFSGTIIFKYHNITPEHFFKPYSKSHFDHCRNGRVQTERLISSFPSAIWLADSEYNRLELIQHNHGLVDSKVVPPFHKNKFIPSRLNLKIKKSPTFLFVGRVAPNKGHKTLLRIFNEYLLSFNKTAKLEIIGSTDPHLKKYQNELFDLGKKLGLSSQITWRSKLSDDEIKRAFINADIFLCFSEHEGFCVPIIEAQSKGLPVIASDTGAIKETLGPNQLIDSFPTRKYEYIFYAKVINEVLQNSILRNEVIEQGYKNFNERFTFDKLADSFAEIIASILMKR